LVTSAAAFAQLVGLFPLAILWRIQKVVLKHKDATVDYGNNAQPQFAWIA
jgi:hypothetical protein